MLLITIQIWLINLIRRFGHISQGHSMAFRVSPPSILYSRSCSFSRQIHCHCPVLERGRQSGDQMVPEILSYWAFGSVSSVQCVKSPFGQNSLLTPESLFYMLSSSRSSFPLSIHLDPLQPSSPSQPAISASRSDGISTNIIWQELFILLPSWPGVPQ